MKTINQKNTEQIIECFTQIVTYTKLQNKLGQYDFSKELELVTKDILNTLFGFNLKFLESEQANHPGIDLGDIKNKIAVQVTSQNTKNKITTTLNLFKKHKLEKNYSKILIVIWNLEKAPTSVESDIPYDIMTPVDFVNVFKGLNDAQQNKFISYLSINFDMLKQTFNNRILTNKKAVLPNNFDNLYSILEMNDCEIDNTLQHDIDLVLNQFSNNLELLSSKERQLLYDCLTISKT
ncbi:SMEK domain-containing protein [Sporosarcina saromensis]|uniref:SMEK domain-containing protein n=1 Tax=Sporosarcina saromensis TaxID=359365 RepID=A0ABU4GAK9_9BACL|nr:SMEK domain-containing protein [Sporosarcina saromensis]MDW0114005.1 SMEK domain-containing protein [Sporosarcina saromensis]